MKAEGGEEAKGLHTKTINAAEVKSGFARVANTSGTLLTICRATYFGS